MFQSQIDSSIERNEAAVFDNVHTHINHYFDGYDCEQTKLGADGNVNIKLDDDYFNHSEEEDVGIYDIRLEAEQDLLYKSLILFKKL